MQRKPLITTSNVDLEDTSAFRRVYRLERTKDSFEVENAGRQTPTAYRSGHLIAPNCPPARVTHSFSR